MHQLRSFYILLCIGVFAALSIAGVAGAAGIATGPGEVAAIRVNDDDLSCQGSSCVRSIDADEPITGLEALSSAPTLMGEATTLTASVSAGSAVTYLWSFGDGAEGSGANASHTYTTAGTYTATVTAANDAGSMMSTVVVEVADAIVELRGVEFMPKEVTIPPGGRVLWIRIDGNHNVRADDDSFVSGFPSDTWNTYDRIFETAGVYPYHCELHGGANGGGMSGTVIVKDGTNTEPTGLTATNDGPTELGEATSFSAAVTSGDTVTYTWDFGDGSGGTGSDLTHTYTETGSFPATVTASNIVSSTVATTTVEVADAVVKVLDFEFEPKTISIPQDGRVIWVRIEGNHNVVADDNSFSSGAPSSTWETYSRTFTATGSIPYYCVLHGGPTGIGMAGVVNVTAEDVSPINGLTAANSGPTLLGEQSVLSATITAGSDVRYSWDFGDGNSGSGAVTPHTYAASGAYTVTVTATNEAGSANAVTVVEVADAVVEVRNNVFEPLSVTVPMDGRVVWMRIEGIHNVRADDDRFTSGLPTDTWNTYGYTFDAAGAYPYYCELHGAAGGGGMAGMVTVSGGSGSDREKLFLPLVGK